MITKMNKKVSRVKYMIVIDPSKGGSDEGIVANGIIEKDFNLLISNYI